MNEFQAIHLLFETTRYASTTTRRLWKGWSL